MYVASGLYFICFYMEILFLDTEYDLGIREKAWSRGMRAKSIAATRDARELCRRGKFGGFLNIRKDRESEEVRFCK